MRPSSCAIARKSTSVIGTAIRFLNGVSRGGAVSKNSRSVNSPRTSSAPTMRRFFGRCSRVATASRLWLTTPHSRACHSVGLAGAKAPSILVVSTLRRTIMQRRSSNASFPTELLSSRAIALLSSDLPLEEKLQPLELMRGACEPREFDRLIIEHVGHLSNGLQTAQQKQGELGDVLEKLTAPPFFPAIFLHMADVSEGRNAMVRLGSELRAVALGDGIYEEDLAVGDEVLLSNERNAIVGKPGEGCFEGGDLATFSRFLGSSRCVLKSRDEEFVAVTTRALRASDIRPGDEGRCDRAFAVALEEVEPS